MPALVFYVSGKPVDKCIPDTGCGVQAIDSEKQLSGDSGSNLRNDFLAAFVGFHYLARFQAVLLTVHCLQVAMLTASQFTESRHNLYQTSSASFWSNTP